MTPPDDNRLIAPIDAFKGRYAFLSNFYAAPVQYCGEAYPTVEHAYQAAKTLDFDVRRRIRAARTPGVAKRIGQLVSLRPQWDIMRCDVMMTLVWQKFLDAQLRLRLLDTGTRPLIEGNGWGDRFWGVAGGQGENQLGRILMIIRQWHQTYSWTEQYRLRMPDALRQRPV
jgi:ribA/ribD-fused uncharacterized protein